MARDAGADFLGLVGPMPSGPGTLSLERAAEIASDLEGPAASVLLSSSDTVEDLVHDCTIVRASMVQIVRLISPEAHRALAKRLPDVQRWQVIHVEGAEAPELAATYAPLVDAVLLDSGRPAAGELGGTGRVHDWSISRACVEAADCPVILAGGLTPDRVGDAIQQVRPWGVDVCSGLRSDDRLDPGKLSQFLSAIDEVS